MTKSKIDFNLNVAAEETIEIAEKEKVSLSSSPVSTD